MKIAVINEVSASIRNEDIVNALHKTTNAEVLNVGMKNPEQTPSLTYIHTSYMAAVLLNTGSCDFVIGGMRHRTGFFKWCTAIPGGGVRFDRGTVRRLALFTNKRRQLRVPAA